jgi:hypothetical protein
MASNVIIKSQIPSPKEASIPNGELRSLGFRILVGFW